MASSEETLKGLPDPEILSLRNEDIKQNDAFLSKNSQQGVANQRDLEILNASQEQDRGNGKHQQERSAPQNDLRSSLPRLVEVNAYQPRFLVTNMIEQHWNTNTNELNQSNTWSNSIDSHISAVGGAAKMQFSFLNSQNQMFNSSNNNNSISREQSIYLDSGHIDNSIQTLLLSQSSKNNQQQDELFKQKKQQKSFGHLEIIEEVASFKKSFPTSSQDSKESQIIQERQYDSAQVNTNSQNHQTLGQEKQKLFEFLKAIPGALSKLFEAKQQKFKEKIASCIVGVDAAATSNKKQECSPRKEETATILENVLQSEDHKREIKDIKDVPIHAPTQKCNQNQEHQADSDANIIVSHQQPISKLPSDLLFKDQAQSSPRQQTQIVELKQQQAQGLRFTRLAGENPPKQLLDSPEKQNSANQSNFSAHKTAFLEGFSNQKTKYFLQESQIQWKHLRNSSLQHNRPDNFSKSSLTNSFGINRSSVEQTKQRSQLLSQIPNDVLLRQAKYASQTTPKVLNIELSGIKLPLCQQNPLQKRHHTNPNVSSPLEFYSQDQHQHHQGLTSEQSHNQPERRGNVYGLNLNEELIHYPGLSPHLQKKISLKNCESLNKSAYGPLHRQTYISRQIPSQLQNSPTKGNTFMHKFLTFPNSPSRQTEKKNSILVTNQKQFAHERRLSPIVSCFNDERIESSCSDKMRVLSASRKYKQSGSQRKQPENVQISKTRRIIVATKTSAEEDRQCLGRQKQQQYQSVLLEKNSPKAADLLKKRQIKVINKINFSLNGCQVENEGN